MTFVAERKSGAPRSILIMTATITPPADAPGMRRLDPAVRLNDYSLALQHYLGMVGPLIDAIVFVENSSSDLDSLRDLASAHGCADQVEFLAFNGMDEPVSYGRCYGESRILDFAMEHSQIIAHSGHDAIIYKITGRYKIMNMSRLMRSRPRAFDLYCDMRFSGSPWADMRFMAWSKRGYEICMKAIADEIREDTNNGRPGEESLYFALRRRFGDALVVTSYRREPLIDGIRGFDNANWSQGKRKLVYWFRDLQRIFLRRVVL